MIAKLKSIPGRIDNAVKKVREHWLFALLRIVGAVVLALIVLSVIGIVIYWAFRPDIAPEWIRTGFGEYTYSTSAQPNEEVVPAKTLWDWMGLLIIPLVLGVGVFLLNRAQRRNEQEIAQSSRETDRDIARDRQHQTTLETYFDRMTELILDNGLGTKKAKKGVQSIARTRTLAVLRSLDTERVGVVFQFIQDAGLDDISLANGNLIGVKWKGADLNGADLSRAYLYGATLSGTRLREANLSGANLFGADLIKADLNGADLSHANLSVADLDRADLRHANLEKAHLSGAILSGTRLREANLSGANLFRADLSNAYLYGANLSGADLITADLNWADLSHANLSGADLDRADLSHANLSGANLSGAINYWHEQLREASSLKGATMPDGTKYEDWIKTHGEDD